MKKVSVIISAFNSEKFLEQALDSLLRQTFNDFEIILVDDASSDKTKDIIKAYSRLDSRITPIYNDKNLGLTKNLNRAIELSQGEYIARMDADDVALASRFEVQVRYLDTHKNIDIVGSAAIDIDENGNELQLRKSPEFHDQIIELLPKANPMTHSTVMFRRAQFAKIAYYNESYRTTQDYEMWFRAAGQGLMFHNLQEVLLMYRMDNNYHKRKSFKYRLFDFKLRLQGFKHIDLPLYKYYYALIPIILGILPERLYNSIKRIDPRVNKLD